ncbi:MAG: hypothetical protein Q9214_001195 [Letrouitia sp. 1 TL-2023]
MAFRLFSSVSKGRLVGGGTALGLAGITVDSAFRREPLRLDNGIASAVDEQFHTSSSYYAPIGYRGKTFQLKTNYTQIAATSTVEVESETSPWPTLPAPGELSLFDIGTNPAEAESNPTEHFAQAKLWDAVLLIDEADIYMENRERQDLARNSLVSDNLHFLNAHTYCLTHILGFLRALERCQSILFLTTNRIGSFDDAFISRIHVTFYYHDLTEKKREMLWRNFFDKLVRDRGGLMRVPIDTKDYIKGQDVRALKWNGREIRNAMQTAVALTDFERETDEDGKILLKHMHIAQIVRMSSDFRDYLDVLHRGDESKRAATQRIRYDHFEYQNGISGNEKERT